MKYIVAIFLAHGIAWPIAFAAPKPVIAPQTLAERDREVKDVRPVLVVVPQRQIETTIELTRLPATNSGGGALGGLIVRARDDRAQTLATTLQVKAVEDAAPIRAALSNFDVEALALSTTRAALEKPAWFKLGDAKLSKDDTVQERAAFLASVTSAQAAIVVYRYSLSPDFTNIRVIADVLLGGKQPSAAQLTPLYGQRISSIVQLSKRSYEQSENAAAWSKGDGKLAKEALTAAFARLETLIPYALGLTEAETRAMSAKEGNQIFAAGFYGRAIPRVTDQPSEVLLWSKGLVHVATTPNTAAPAVPP